ncbi:MAG: hypothetical protein EZS28_023441 [Streblomastix strix]|uniref:Uncharacterized protein n=1 Tax=Streblomastix strix TaxID=222440 RepID=A0A5J4VEJ7_9EUKA|nr:MAG: hypothetical protein EZS28_023441 [Streblomastix strix]
MYDEKNTPSPSSHQVVYGKGPVNTIINTNGQTTWISSQSSKDAPWPLLNDIPLTYSLDLDRYITISDCFMNEQGCYVCLDRQSNDIQIRFYGELKSVINERGHFDPKSGMHLDADYWGFDPSEDIDLWTACIIAKAAITKANRLSDGQERKRQAKFESLEEAKIAQDVATMLYGIINQDAKDADMLTFQLQPIQRQKLFDEIEWNGANVVFPVLSAEAPLPVERSGLSHKALESACAVNQGITSLIHDIARNRTSNLASKLCKIKEAFLSTVDDTQRERESRLKGIQEAPDEQDVLSKTSREKFKKRKYAKSVVGN